MKKIIDFSTFATQCSIFLDRRSRSVLIVDAKRLKARILIIIKLLIYFSLVGLSAEPRFNNINRDFKIWDATTSRTLWLIKDWN